MLLDATALPLVPQGYEDENKQQREFWCAMSLATTGSLSSSLSLMRHTGWPGLQAFGWYGRWHAGLDTGVTTLAVVLCVLLVPPCAFPILFSLSRLPHSFVGCSSP